MRYRFLKHTADIKFQAEGNSLEQAFENSAYALKEVMLRDLGKKKVSEQEKKIIEVDGKDKVSLLFDLV
jgi:SHS2 domain-containing protein